MLQRTIEVTGQFGFALRCRFESLPQKRGLALRRVETLSEFGGEVQELLDLRLKILKTRGCGSRRRCRDAVGDNGRKRAGDQGPSLVVSALEAQSREPVVELAVACRTMADIPALDREARSLQERRRRR